MASLEGRVTASSGHRFALTCPCAECLIRLPVGSSALLLGIFKHAVKSAQAFLRRTYLLLQILADENLLVMRRAEVTDSTQTPDRDVSATFSQAKGDGRLPAEVGGAIRSTRSRLFSEHRGGRRD